MVPTTIPIIKPQIKRSLHHGKWKLIIPFRQSPTYSQSMFHLTTIFPWCAHFLLLYFKSKLIKEINYFCKKHPIFFLSSYLSAYTGLKVRTYYDIADIYSILYIEQLYNFTLPNWTESVFPNKMAEPAGYR